MFIVIPSSVSSVGSPRTSGKALIWICTGREPGVGVRLYASMNRIRTASMSATSAVSCSGVSRRLMVSLVAMSSHSSPKMASPSERNSWKFWSRDPEPLVLDEPYRETLGAARWQRAGVGDRDGAGGALPPPFPALPAGRVLADEAGALELAEVVARGPARFAEPLSEPARGQRAVRRELVVDAHAQGVRERLQAVGRDHVIDAGVPQAARLCLEVVGGRFVHVAKIPLQRNSCKCFFAAVCLQLKRARGGIDGA